MAEIYETENPQQLDVQRYVDIVRRRHMHFLIPLLVGWLAVWGASWLMQTRYKSSTLILVEQPSVPQNFVASNVTDDLQARLQSIQQQILSRTRLLMIINRLHLYEGSDNLTPDEKVARMQKEIDIELVRDAGGSQITAFRINYSAHDPHVAQNVTRELSELFINENSAVLQQESEDTTKFLEDQLDAARANLAEQEAKVRAFESGHEGELPSQQTSNLQILAGLQAELQNEQDALNAATQQRAYYQTLIEQYKALRPTTAAAKPDDVVALDAQLDKLRAQLAELSSRYTDSFPDVQSVKDQIARTEKMRAAAVAAASKKTAAGSQDETNAPTLQLQGQIESNQVEIANRQKAITQLQARINDYQTRLNAEPASEQELADLNRGYDQSKANYDDLLKKKQESAMATSMEEMQRGERFSILDPPSLPQTPDFPNRLKFCGIGVAVGAALGLLVVIAFELVDDRMHSEKDIRDMLPVPVISEIPEIISSDDEKKSHRQRMRSWAMTAAVLVIILLGSAVSYLHS